MSLFSIPPSDPRLTETVDIDALCARPSATPARDLTPPTLLSVAPPIEEPIGETTRAHRILGLVQKTSRRQRLLAAAGVALAFIGIATFFAASGSAQARTVDHTLPIALPIANAIEALPPPPPDLPLPPPPTTGALGSPKAPVRAAPAKPRLVAAPTAVKMIRVH